MPALHLFLIVMKKNNLVVAAVVVLLVLAGGYYLLRQPAAPEPSPEGPDESPHGRSPPVVDGVVEEGEYSSEATAAGSLLAG